MTPDQYCQQKAADSGSSFYYSFLFLPKAQRRAITALYAFCREVDDIADAEMENKIKLAKLEWWRNEVDNLFNHTPQHPVTRALLEPVQRYNLAREYFHEIIDGMEMDLDSVRYASFKDLNLYCYRVAGVVGLLSASIFGYRNRLTMKYAQELGLAFQLTNIIRDVVEDAQRDRIYLPLDELAQFGVSEADILTRRDSEQFHALMQFQAQRAHACYQRAFDYLPREDRYRQRTGIIMAAIYRTTLQEMEADGLQVLKHRVLLPPRRKILLAVKTLFSEWWHYRRLQAPLAST